MRTERDLRNQIAYARESGVEEGLARGREDGREEGREEERARLLAELRKQGIPDDVLDRAVGATKNGVSS